MATSSPEWQLSMTFANRAKYILDNGNWSDCAFSFENDCSEIVNAHKIFLAMASPVFEKMFYGPLAEKKSPILIKDIRLQDFKHFLQYVYAGSIALNCLEDAIRVSYIAKKYMVPDIIKLCGNRVWDFLSPATACHAYEFALFSDDKELEQQCLKIISLDTLHVINNPSFETIDLTTLETILDMDKLNINSEMELYAALKRWALSECSRRAKMGDNVSLDHVVRTAVPKLRFLTLKPKEFVNGTVGSELLPVPKLYSILIKIISPEMNVSLPPNFSTSKTKRNAAMIIRRTENLNQNARLSAFGQLISTGTSLSQNNTIKKPQGYYHYLWICNVKLIQETKGVVNVTNIHFEVTKRIKILGIQMNANYNYYNRSSENTLLVCIHLETDDGKEVSTSHLFQLNMRSAANVKVGGENILERKKRYVLKIAYCYVFSEEFYSFENASFGKANLQQFENLPIKSIAFIE